MNLHIGQPPAHRSHTEYVILRRRPGARVNQVVRCHPIHLPAPCSPAGRSDCLIVEWHNRNFFSGFKGMRDSHHPRFLPGDAAGGNVATGIDQRRPPHAQVLRGDLRQPTPWQCPPDRYPRWQAV